MDRSKYESSTPTPPPPLQSALDPPCVNLNPSREPDRPQAILQIEYYLT